MTTANNNLVWFDQRPNWKEFVRLIFEAESVIKRQQEASQGKLKDTIDRIKENTPFCDFPVVYLPKTGTVIFIGDTHGDSLSSMAVLKQEDFFNKIMAGQDIFVVFLGDYADRGREDIKNLEVVLNLKMKYPNNVFLLRGNHEELYMGQYYGLLTSCIKRFEYEKGQYVFKKLNDFFEKLPVMVVCANGVIAVHGGIPIGGIDSLLSLDDEEDQTEIRWNDPTEEIDHFVFNYRRGAYYLFGKKVFKKFLNDIGGTVMVRSHEYITAGYKFLFNNRLITIFSNGGASKESGYQDFILYPKYVKVDLSKPVKKWEEKHIFDIKVGK